MNALHPLMPKILQPTSDSTISAEDARAFISEFLGSHNVYLVAGPHAYAASGAAALFDPLLAKRKAARFAAFSPNPKIEELDAALAAFQQSETERIVAIGGGSAIDLGKLVNYFASTGLTPDQYLRGKRATAPRFMSLLAVPTTAGTGSEATHFAVLYAGSVKYSIADPGLRPSHVLLNPDFTHSLPPDQAACAGFDALAHAVESFWAITATAASRLKSQQALELVLPWLTVHVTRSTSQSRAAMMRAAFLAGQAIDIAKTTAAHALSYSLTAHGSLPHGHAISVFLPVVARSNVELMLKANGEAGNAARVLLERFQCATGNELEDRLIRLREQIGLNHPFPRLSQLDAQALIDRIGNEVNLERLSNNPGTLTKVNLRRLVARALGI